MLTRFVEATQGIDKGFNHGKFMVGIFEPVEWQRRCEIDAHYSETQRSLLGRCGWSLHHFLVADLQTGEGALFNAPGSASADLDKHRVWVCPMFEPFLAWLYKYIGDTQQTGPMTTPLWFPLLPSVVELPKAEPAVAGYRRDPMQSVEAVIAAAKKIKSTQPEPLDVAELQAAVIAFEGL